MAKVNVMVPSNFGKTIKRNAIDVDKWDVHFDDTHFEYTTTGLKLKDSVLEPLRQADIASGSLVGSNLELVKNDGSKISVPLSSLVPAAKADQFLKSVSYDGRSKKLKFAVGNDTNADETQLEVSVADLLPVVVGAGLEGDGTSANPLKLKVKTGQPFTVTADGIELDKASDALVELTDGTGTVSLGYIFKSN